MIERIKSLISQLGLSTRAFAIKCGISQKTLDNQIKGLRSVSLETTVSILNAFPEISAEWLLRGDGDMFKRIARYQCGASSETGGYYIILQESINAKTETINALNERIKQLESKASK